MLASGLSSTFAGNVAGTVGSTGDGGLATSATLSAPSAVAVAANGDVYILDRCGGTGSLMEESLAFVATAARHFACIPRGCEIGDSGCMLAGGTYGLQVGWWELELGDYQLQLCKCCLSVVLQGQQCSTSCEGIIKLHRKSGQ